MAPLTNESHIISQALEIAYKVNLWRKAAYGEEAIRLNEIIKASSDLTKMVKKYAKEQGLEERIKKL